MSSNTYDVDSDYQAAIAPEAVLALMADVLDAALLANVDVVHPTEVVLSAVGRRRLAVGSERPTRSATSAPELARKEGAGDATKPKTLSYSVGVIGALSALGSLEVTPELPDAHRAWVGSVVDQLRRVWSGRWRADEVAGWIARCLAFEPAERPDARALLDELIRLRSQGPLDEQRPRPLAVPAPRLALAAHPPPATPLLTPFAMVALLVAFVAFSAGLCTLGAAVDQVAGSIAKPEPPPAEATTPPPAVVVAPAPVVVTIPDPPPPDPVTPEEPPVPAQESEVRSVDFPISGPPTAPPPHTGSHGARTSETRTTPASPLPAPTDKSAPPKGAPGRDLRDPWNR